MCRSSVKVTDKIKHQHVGVLPFGVGVSVLEVTDHVIIHPTRVSCGSSTQQGLLLLGLGVFLIVFVRLFGRNNQFQELVVKHLQGQ